MTFTLTDDAGAGVWSAWHDNVDWRSGERKQIRVDWEGDVAGPVAYRVAVSITTRDRATVYGRADNAATLTFGR